METSFWFKKWGANEIGFHGSEANPLLVKHFSNLSLAEGSRVFLPLCGKTLDIDWLLARGCRVAGAELVPLAVEEVFERAGLAPEVSIAGGLKHYRAGNIDLFAGNIFQLTKEMLGPVDAVYDRAALVALPAEVRPRYTKHLTALSDRARQLLLCYEYDQNLKDGPPFSITENEVRSHYETKYQVKLLESVQVEGGLKGEVPAKENVWLIEPTGNQAQ